MTGLTHLDENGGARMVDIAAKPASARRALAQGAVRMKASTLARAREGDVKKGEVTSVSRLAGIMAAKRAAELIPLAIRSPSASSTYASRLTKLCRAFWSGPRRPQLAPQGLRWKRSPLSRWRALPFTTC